MHFNCYICSELTRIELKEDHHVNPQATGGSDGKQERLCLRCHKIMHIIAKLLLDGKSGSIRDILQETLPNNVKAQKKLSNLSFIVYQQLQLKKEGKLTVDIEKITIEISSNTKQLLKLIAIDTGKSMTKLTTDIINNFVKRRYPNVT